ncbi:homolog of X-ray repair cross complementing 2, partial [Prunus dulcis]
KKEKKRKGNREGEKEPKATIVPLPLPLKILALRTMQMAAKGWIDGDESAAKMLGRVATERPFLLLPPLHRVPLRVGNVVELVGPSASAKTHILIQAAVNCILPKEWNGVHYGGLERLVMFIDLDCRFDILRLSEILKHQIMEPNGSMYYDEELYALCMRRFLYVRCYDSLEFLATLKTLHYRLQKEKEVHHVGIQLLMIDRKCLSLQSVFDAVVQDIKKLLLVHPMLVMATKEIILGNAYGGDEVKQNKSLLDASGLRNLASNTQQLPYREYMPSVWQWTCMFNQYITNSHELVSLLSRDLETGRSGPTYAQKNEGEKKSINHILY